MANLAKEQYRSGEIYIYYKHRREEMDRILDGCLLEDQKEIVDAFLQEMDTASRQELDAVYFQGMLDGVTILRDLGALI
ncbi:MAG: hypothetical protein HFE66_07685 [Clostridiales bacterium]|nr:hypothetical protein [Clostridiales bacterium]